MTKPKTIRTKTGEQHFSVGAIIENKDKILIMERKLPPKGFAGIAGHIDEKETPLDALKREIKEETNLDLISASLLFKKLIIQKEDCTLGLKRHKWYVYRCVCKGEIKPSKKEVKSIRVLTRDKIKKLYNDKKLEYAWVVIFKKLKII